MSTKTFCDGCGVPLINNAAAPAYKAQAQIATHGGELSKPLYSTPLYDLCLKCKEKFMAAVDIRSWRSPHGL